MFAWVKSKRVYTKMLIVIFFPPLGVLDFCLALFQHIFFILLLCMSNIATFLVQC